MSAGKAVMGFSDNNNYRSPVFLAIALHVVLFAALFIHFASKPTTLNNAQSATQIINATVVNQNPSPSKPAPAPAKPAPTPPQPKPVPPTPKPQPATPKPVEQQAAQELATQQAEQKKQAQQKLVEHQNLVAQQVQKELAAEEKKAKAKQRLAAKKAAEQSAKQLLQQELAANPSVAESPAAESKSESKAEAKPAALSAQAQGEIDKYKTLIVQAISQQWIVPDNLTKGLEAKLLVTLAPGGMVVDVKIVKSSGDPVLDRSAQTAVYKASPLPVPADSALFNKFRTINLIVRPEGILAGG